MESENKNNKKKRAIIGLTILTILYIAFGLIYIYTDLFQFLSLELWILLMIGITIVYVVLLMMILYKSGLIKGNKVCQNCGAILTAKTFVLSGDYSKCPRCGMMFKV
ncbi:MAG: hypothetical protein J5783_03355 [Lachnospiraceae bacterium]|nr:hypothetical protein [Lachnospiraceae bacterium]